VDGNIHFSADHHLDEYSAPLFYLFDLDRLTWTGIVSGLTGLALRCRNSNSSLWGPVDEPEVLVLSRPRMFKFQRRVIEYDLASRKPAAIGTVSK
jgi:hypothetical protein